MRQNKTQSRRFQQLGSLLRKPISDRAAGRGFSKSRLLTQWAEIAGAELSEMCQPVKIRFSKSGLKSTLVLLTTGANAPILQMQIPQILERVNTVYGYRAVHDIHITQISANGLAETQSKFTHAKPTKPLSKESKEALAALVEDVEDDSLRMALTRLGHSVKEKQI